MKERILQAEMVIEMEKIHNVKGVEINLLLSAPVESRRYHQIPSPIHSHPGYPSSMPERKGCGVNEDSKKSVGNLSNRACVKVNSVLVCVNTRHVNL